jgi:hypothetical protein
MREGARMCKKKAKRKIDWQGRTIFFVASWPGYNALPWGGLMKRIACLLVIVLIGAACFAQTANKETASNPGFPRVVAKLSALGKTAPINPGILYTPQYTGLFRVTFVGFCTIGNGNLNNDAWTGGIAWTDELEENVPEGLNIYVKTPYASSNSFAFQAVGGQPITFSTSSYGDTSGTKYNVYVVLEQLE